MKNIQKKMFCFFHVLMLFAILTAAHPAYVNAKIKTILAPAKEMQTAVAGMPVIEHFSISAPCEITSKITAEVPVSFTITVYSHSGIELDSFHFTESDPDWLSSKGVYFNSRTTFLTAGTYTAILVFDETASYQFSVTGSEASISSQKLTLTAGFQKTLSVYDNAGSVTWRSSDLTVASVNSSGKVTAKSAGTCTITASVDGRNLKCTLTVKANKYSAEKYTNKDIPNGSASLKTFSAYYDQSGNLVLKCRMVNNVGHYSEYLKNLTIKVKTGDKKTAAIRKISKMDLYVADKSYKDFKITIKKADLSIQKIDLSKASVTIGGQYGYTYYVRR